MSWQNTQNVFRLSYFWKIVDRRLFRIMFSLYKYYIYYALIDKTFFELWLSSIKKHVKVIQRRIQAKMS